MKLCVKIKVDDALYCGTMVECYVGQIRLLLLQRREVCNEMVCQ